MVKLKKSDLCRDREYINLKKLSIKTGIRKNGVDEVGLKTTYIIDQNGKFLNEKDIEIDLSDGVTKRIFFKEQLNNMYLVEVNYSSRSSKGKFKVYYVVDGIKYALSINDFEDVYKEVLMIIKNEILDKEEVKLVVESFNQIDKREAIVDKELNLDRFKEFSKKANYKRNVKYFVINNTLASVSKFNINDNRKEINQSGSIKVLRYDKRERLYYTLMEDKVSLKETDIICTFENNIWKVEIYTEYGMGKLLDIENNVIPSGNFISLFANIQDLGIKVLRY